MTTNPGPSMGINLTDSWGAILAATFVSLMLYGVSILQTFLYYERYTQDSIPLKSLVAWVFALDTAHIALMCAGVWQIFILHFGDADILLYTDAPPLYAAIIGAVVAATVQSFFIYRIWSLTRSRFRWLFPFILMPFEVAQIVLGILYAVIALPPQTKFTIFSEPLLTKVALGFCGIASGVDVIITISLCTLLAMGRTGFESTDRMISRLIFITVNTGLSSALFAFVATILLAIYPSQLTFTALYFPLSGVYCNTMLASLNARSFVRGGVGPPQLSKQNNGRPDRTQMPNRWQAIASHRLSHRDLPIEIVRPPYSLTASAPEGRWQANGHDCWIGESSKNCILSFASADDTYEMA